MAYQYSAYAEQPTPALQLAMARQHLTELNDLVKPGVGKDGAYRNSFDLVQRIGKLEAEIQRLEVRVAARRGGMSRIVRGTAR